MVRTCTVGPVFLLYSYYSDAIPGCLTWPLNFPFTSIVLWPGNEARVRVDWWQLQPSVVHVWLDGWKQKQEEKYQLVHFAAHSSVSLVLLLYCVLSNTRYS